MKSISGLLQPARIILSKNRGNANLRQNVKVSHDTASNRFAVLLSSKDASPLNKIVITANAGENSKNILANKGKSTPYDCAMHISSSLAESGLCLKQLTKHSSSKTIASMREPIDGPCTLSFISFEDKQFADEINQAYWRSCSLVLGSHLSHSFSRPVTLLGRVNNHFSDGYFAYDIKSTELQTWEPSKRELASLVSSLQSRFVGNTVPFESFRDDEQDGSYLVRVGDHVESVDGPVISHAGQIGRFAIVKASKLPGGVLRFCGVSVPASQPVSSHNWEIIVDHAAKAAH